MVKIKEIELPRNISVNEIRDILEGVKENSVMWFKNDFINIKVVKIDVGILIYLVFGEHYVLRNECRGNWDNVVFISDNLDDLAFYIHSL